jgi:hypothetical protein
MLAVRIRCSVRSERRRNVEREGTQSFGRNLGGVSAGVFFRNTVRHDTIWV